MSTVDILESLIAEGEVESEGGFSIDKEKAREKMRQFQLTDPRQYVLMLVQAAVHQGATHVEFRIDADDMEVWFDGEGFSRSDLDDLFVSMFGDRGASNLRSRQELAIALNAALALNPRWVRMTSHREGKAVSLELRPGTAALPPAEDTTPLQRGGTSIHVKQRFRPGLLVEFVRDMQGTIAEEFILRERVRFAELPVILDGDRISSGLLLDAAVGRVDVDGPRISGACGFRDDSRGASLEVLNAGVWMSTHPLPSFPPGFVAMVDARDLRKDVSQTDVVRDETYGALLGRLQAGLERSLLAIVRVFHDDPPRWFEVPLAVRSRMPTFLAERIHEPARLAQIGDVLHLYDGLPIWQQLDGQWVSTQALRERSNVDFISRPSAPSQEFALAVRAETEELRVALRAIFDTAARDRTGAYEEAFAREAKRAEVMARPWSTSLGEGLYLARVNIEAEGVRGEVGIRRSDREDPVVQIVYEGCLLETIALDRHHLHLPGFVAVVEGSASPSSDWTRAQRNAGMARAMHAVIEATAKALELAGQLGEPPPPGCERSLRDLAQAVCQGSLDSAFYRAVGFGVKGASRWVKRFGTTLAADPFDPPHPLLTVALFRQLRGAPRSLLDLRRDHSPANPLRVLPEGGAWNEGYDGYVVTDVGGTALLQQVLGEDAVVDGEEAYHGERGRQAWLNQPEEPFEVHGDTALTVAFSAEGMEAKAGMLAPASREQSSLGRASVRVMKNRRTVEFVTLPCPVGGTVVVVDWLKAPVTAEYSALQAGATTSLEPVVALAPARLFASGLEALTGGAAAPDLVGCMRALLLRPFLGQWLEPFDRRHDEAGSEVATDRLVELLKVTAKRDGEPPSNDSAAKLFEDGKTGAIEEGRRALVALAQQVGVNWTQAREVPMFPALGRIVSLAEILADLRRHDTALVVDADQAPAFEGEVPRIVLLARSAERAELERVFGRDRIADGLSWFEQWRAREAFEQQPKVELDLDPSRVLVSVPVQAKGTQGEIGLPRAMPGAPSARILACRRRRRVCSVDVPEAQASFVGVLQSDSFGVDRQFQSLSERDMVRIAATCRKARPELARALAAAWSSFGAFEVTLGRAWGRLLLQLLLDGRGRKALEEESPQALAELPLFEHADGSFWTLDRLLAAREGDEQVYLHREGDAFEGSFPALTFIERPHVASVLEPLVGKPKALAEVVRARHAQERNRSASPDMPKPPPDAVEVGDVSGRGLEGALWIDARLDEGAVALGDAQKVAGFTTVSPVFVVGGAVWGPGVEIDEAWVFATLEKRAEKLLYKRAQGLYGVVHERFDPLAMERDAGWFRDQAVLRALLLRMLAEWGAGRKSNNASTRRLFKALQELPLFVLPNGRAVTLVQAERFHALGDEREPTHAPTPEPEATPEPEPEPEATPAPEPLPPPPTPRAVLLDAIRTEIRIVRKGSVAGSSNAMLDLVRFGGVSAPGVVAEFVRGAVLIAPRHPVVELALRSTGEARARYVSMLASSVFTAFNLGLQEVTDQHEVEFHRAHAEHLGA